MKACLSPFTIPLILLMYVYSRYIKTVMNTLLYNLKFGNVMVSLSHKIFIMKILKILGMNKENSDSDEIT